MSDFVPCLHLGQLQKISTEFSSPTLNADSLVRATFEPIVVVGPKWHRCPCESLESLFNGAQIPTIDGLGLASCMPGFACRFELDVELDKVVVVC